MKKCRAEIYAEDVGTTETISSIARTHDTRVFLLCVIGQSLESLPLAALRQRVAVWPHRQRSPDGGQGEFQFDQSHYTQF